MFKFLQSIIICAALVLSASVVADTLPLFIELCILGIAVLAAYVAYKLEDVKWEERALPALFFSEAGALEPWNKDSIFYKKKIKGRKAARILSIIKKGVRPQGRQQTKQSINKIYCCIMF